MGPASRDGGDSLAPSLRLHVALLLTLAACAVAFSVELSRALGGNALSWAYVFEWPLLGGFGVYMWWRLRHPAPATVVREVEMTPQMHAMREAWLSAESDRRARNEETGS